MFLSESRKYFSHLYILLLNYHPHTSFAASTSKGTASISRTTPAALFSEEYSNKTMITPANESKLDRAFDSNDTRL